MSARTTKNTTNFLKKNNYSVLPQSVKQIPFVGRWEHKIPKFWFSYTI